MSEKFVDALKHEVAEEKAGALGRCGRRLEHALERFRSHDRADLKRERLLWDLAERVEAFVVQREACGLRDSATCSSSTTCRAKPSRASARGARAGATMTRALSAVPPPRARRRGGRSGC